ncbi:2-oxo-tetronate isomerase [Variovorax sp. dw_308]|uniref:2-oxo-tetronate isomerase n=1 Tax=Variovorax sp. dw_308 TaxID=2721546 RepID=UPI001C465A5E|nr:2-oxo-tetronate isomerase [Variovorax sp. dw_308]
MPRFAANLSMLYTDRPFLDRFEAAARDGFKAVEYLFPYAFPANELAARLKANGLQQVLFNAPPGGDSPETVNTAWEQGSRGTASVPGREAEFRYGVRQALEYAAALDCPRIHVMAGLLADDQTREGLRGVYIDNLHWAAVEAAKSGRDILIEPINTRDVPRFFLNRQDHAHEIVEAVGALNLRVQMDLYHCQIVEGDVAMKLRKYLPTGRVGHMQIAGVPERHEPDIGELNHPYLFSVIDELAAQGHWDGWIGCEYRPRGGTGEGLGWARGLL